MGLDLLWAMPTVGCANAPVRYSNSRLDVDATHGRGTALLCPYEWSVFHAIENHYSLLGEKILDVPYC
ncbi:hypothetical protein PQG02_02475 [Nostoc sp. UHCC 0926]|uniref:hypothetical protein n=1 Tax=unclassified Nostoc TaxID=2593658 RepID=UPI00235EBDDB|nr:hypothetical protein [Nostoc sp. UHCC 0926]WDD33289.1 hypothetical protein PQG02_02475 [Nostoc sp. UHCC 0926]